VDLVTNVLYVAVSILLNYLLTVRIGVMGPAWGGLIAIVIFNALRFTFLWKLFKLQPFTIHNLKALLLGAAVFFAVFFIPGLGNLYMDVIIRSGLFTILFAGGILYFRISEDMNAALRSVWLRKR
jgi:O-antigen/teichoic acid export membrane protein